MAVLPRKGILTCSRLWNCQSSWLQGNALSSIEFERGHFARIVFELFVNFSSRRTSVLSFLSTNRNPQGWFHIQFWKFSWKKFWENRKLLRKTQNKKIPVCQKSRFSTSLTNRVPEFEVEDLIPWCRASRLWDGSRRTNDWNPYCCQRWYGERIPIKIAGNEKIHNVNFELLQANLALYYSPLSSNHFFILRDKSFLFSHNVSDNLPYEKIGKSEPVCNGWMLTYLIPRPLLRSQLLSAFE